MDLQVDWSPEAIDDIESIAEFSLIGRSVPETGNERIRERFVYSYRLVYRIEATRILVVAVIHGKRLLENISDRLGDDA